MKFDFEINPIQPLEYFAVKNLVLEGLEEHWGVLDHSKNKDLDNIQENYQNGIFLVAHHGVKVVGCGAIVHHSDGVAEIKRMSVQRHYRRLGVGTLLLNKLVELGRKLGYNRIILETTATWTEVIEFYQTNGFNITHEDNGDVYFALDLVSIARVEQ